MRAILIAFVLALLGVVAAQASVPAGSATPVAAFAFNHPVAAAAVNADMGKGKGKGKHQKHHRHHHKHHHKGKGKGSK
jgi:hypothetical protein